MWLASEGGRGHPSAQPLARASFQDRLPSTAAVPSIVTTTICCSGAATLHSVRVTSQRGCSHLKQSGCPSRLRRGDSSAPKFCPAPSRGAVSSTFHLGPPAALEHVTALAAAAAMCAGLPLGEVAAALAATCSTPLCSGSVPPGIGVGWFVALHTGRGEDRDRARTGPSIATAPAAAHGFARGSVEGGRLRLLTPALDGDCVGAPTPERRRPRGRGGPERRPTTPRRRGVAVACQRRARPRG